METEDSPSQEKVFRKDQTPQPSIIRKRKGQDVQLSVGMQYTLEGPIVPVVDAKPLKGIEKEVAEVQMLGNAQPQTKEEAAKQRRAIRNRSRNQPKNGRR